MVRVGGVCAPPLLLLSRKGRLSLVSRSVNSLGRRAYRMVTSASSLFGGIRRDEPTS
jgi:hypothetical protein